MGYEEPTAPTAGAKISSSLFGIKVRNSLIAIWKGTTAGDIDYYDSATTKARLAKPAVDSILQNTAAGVLSWIANSTFLTTLLLGRQGGSATIFDSPGTTNYTPSGTKFQAGEAQIIITATVSGSVNITFPVAFTYAPLCFAQQVKVVSGGIGGGVVPPICQSVTKDGFTIAMNLNASSTVTLNIAWLAIGI